MDSREIKTAALKATALSIYGRDCDICGKAYDDPSKLGLVFRVDFLRSTQLKRLRAVEASDWPDKAITIRCTSCSGRYQASRTGRVGAPRIEGLRE